MGTSIPEQVVTNDDLSEFLDTSDAWIRQRTGIRERRVVRPGTSTGDLAVLAAEGALKSAGSGEADLVILATTTPDHPCPATAPDVAQRIGLTGVPAFDLSAVCSGFLYGLSCAAGFIRSGAAERVLLIGADTYSTILNPTDRTTRAIFGDGAGAMVLRAGHPGEPGELAGVTLGSDGALRDLITIPEGGSRHPVGDELTAEGRYFTMRGKSVYRHAVQRMVESATRACELAGWRLSEVDHLVAHQANARIISAVGERLRLPAERCAVNLDRLGNTAAASIPLALADAATAGALRPGHRTLLTAFGGGATWGGAALTWPDITPVAV
ncbi:beta-ketoacyl-ACP synthase III [Streptomyces triticirhizae]|uniref:Beta-ketoacyl-[acyl-carrier-protein] synthase III n=1 Tax=Streptomyces triticirhizae TaxID=2483353 RepID=A0A3M2M5M7_9ACTN|nr:beta-ketoacyl-ACP synthase III [Streptomyces triticirhizae]RMI44802.1 ketoacyl-ACP synthase III [Streptomyces triticirhizae]